MEENNIVDNSNFNNNQDKKPAMKKKNFHRKWTKFR